MAKVYIIASEKWYGQEIHAFPDRQSAEMFIQFDPDINYRIHEFNDLGIPVINVCACEKPYGESNEFPLAIFATFEEADRYAVSKSKETGLDFMIDEVTVKEFATAV